MIGILSDAHGNKPALEHAIAVLKTCGAQRFIFLGDALGYLPSCGVLDLIASLGSRIQCIRGNHEDILLSGRYESERDLVYQHRQIRELMTAAEMKQIALWPTSLRLEFEAGTALFVHGSPADPLYGYVYPDSDLSGFKTAEQLVFLAHTHRPFIRLASSTLFVNVGSCGLPRDHGLLGSGGLFDEQTGTVRLIRLDIRQATRQALEEALPVHASILALSERQPQSYEGDLVGR